MTMVGEVHVVPSGKVYRQIFDAEVQLVRSLGEARHRATLYGWPLYSGRIPLVGGLETRAGGLLSHRQQLWVESMPNDGFTENAVLNREAVTLAVHKTEESEAEIEAREVRGLADVIVPEHSDRDILQHVSERRRERHEAAVHDLQRELVRISQEKEPLVLKAGKYLQKQLASSDRKIQLLFQKIEGNTDLSTLSMKDFKALWASLTQESSCRRQRIREIDETLTKLEENRAKQIGDVLKRYTATLEKICYIMPSEVYRFIHKEAMMINQAILANRRAIARLAINLTEADLKRESAQRLRWQDRVKEWKLLWRDAMIHKFRVFMDSEKIQNPKGMQRDVELMVREQKSLNEKRMQLLDVTSDLLPPTCTKSQVTEWYSSLMALNKQIDCLNMQFLKRIRLQHEKVCQMCLAEVQQCKGLLLDAKVCTKEEVEKILSLDFYPLVGQLQRRFEQELELMDRSLECLAKQTNLQSKDLFKFSQGAVHLWDVLEIGLSRQEKVLQKNLDECRQEHDGENQVKEANLDMVLDKLRQESSQEGLQTCMEKALASLEDIRAGYKRFHHDQAKIVASYPNAILREVKSYSSSVSQYFGVKEVFKETLMLQKLEQELEQTPATDDRQAEPCTAEGATVLQEPGRQPRLESEAQDGRGISLPSTAGETPLLQTEPGDGVGITGPVISEGQLPQETAIKDAINRAVPGMLGHQQLPQEGLMAMVPETGAQLPEEMEKDDNTGAAALGITGTTLPEDSEEETRTPVIEIPQEVEGIQTHEVPRAFFTTSNGNSYSLLPLGAKGQEEEEIGVFMMGDQPEMNKTFMTEVQMEDNPPVYLEHILIPKNVFKTLKEWIRLGFYEHLEKWFDKALSNSESVVSAKMEELKSELELRFHLHRPRSQRIEKDIHNVRAAELLLHSDRVERHCSGVMEALTKMKDDSILLRDDMKRKTKDFRKRISDMESSFMNANKSDKLNALTKSLYADRDTHVEGIQIAMRNYRQTLEATLGMLRDSNAEFIKSFRLFSEGGNFSPEEIDSFRKKLEKASGLIDGSEGFIMVDLEGIESKCIEQAMQVVHKFEDKFHSLTVDMIFLENIQRLLTNLQVKIKAEVAKSNMQSLKLHESLEIFSKKIDACARPNMDKEVVPPEELHAFMKSVMEAVVQRSNYLKCLLDPVPVLKEPPLQGPIAAAARQENKVTFAGPEALLQPCKLGRPMYDDVAVGVIKNLLHGQYPVTQVNRRSDQQRSGTGLRQNPAALMPHPPTPPVDSKLNAQHAAPQSAGSAGDKGKLSIRRSSSGSNRKLAKPTRFDKKYQVFGEKPEESVDLKGNLTAMLWESNDTILTLAEEFYKKKERRSIGRSDFLQNTFEECADKLVLKLQSYQSQGDEYHNACLHEFRDQLQQCEGLLAEVPPVLMDDLRKQHLHQLRTAIEEIQRRFSERIRDWDTAKEENRKLLRPSLGHPDSQQALMDLCQQEETRQQELLSGVATNTQSLQDCAAESAESFVTALAALAEALLLEFDESLSVDDIQTAKTEVIKEKLFTLIRRKRARLPLEETKHKPVIERGGRMWPGICRLEVASTKAGDGTADRGDTASVTTGKTSLAHISVVEARDAAYTEFRHNVELEMARIAEAGSSQLSEARRWHKWWQQAVLEIKQLYG